MSTRGDLIRLGLDSDSKDLKLLTLGARLYLKTSVAAITTAGNVTYTAAQLRNIIIDRDPNGGARSDVTPTAALIISEFAFLRNDEMFEFIIVNTADAAEVVTITAGTGVTLVGDMAIGQDETGRFMVVRTSSTAVTIYRSG